MPDAPTPILIELGSLTMRAGHVGDTQPWLQLTTPPAFAAALADPLAGADVLADALAPALAHVIHNLAGGALALRSPQARQATVLLLLNEDVYCERLQDALGLLLFARFGLGFAWAHVGHGVSVWATGATHGLVVDVSPGRARAAVVADGLSIADEFRDLHDYRGDSAAAAGGRAAVARLLAAGRADGEACAPWSDVDGTRDATRMRDATRAAVDMGDIGSVADEALAGAREALAIALGGAGDGDAVGAALADVRAYVGRVACAVPEIVRTVLERAPLDARRAALDNVLVVGGCGRAFRTLIKASVHVGVGDWQRSFRDGGGGGLGGGLGGGGCGVPSRLAAVVDASADGGTFSLSKSDGRQRYARDAALHAETLHAPTTLPAEAVVDVVGDLHPPPGDYLVVASPTKLSSLQKWPPEEERAIRAELQAVQVNFAVLPCHPWALRFAGAALVLARVKKALVVSRKAWIAGADLRGPKVL